MVQRAEMMAEYERRFRMIESKIDRLETRLFNGAGLSYQGERRFGDPDLP